MGFGQEIKDFVSGFQAGYKMIESPSEKEKERRELKRFQDAGIQEAETGVGERRSTLPERTFREDEPDPSSGTSRGARNYLDTDVSVDDEGMKNILKIARRDSGENGYNALTYKRGGGSGGTAPLTDMTIGEVFNLQRQMPSRGHASTAVGGYQFVHDTLKGAVNSLGLPLDTKFTPEVQDKLAAQLVKQRGYDQWKAGKMSDSAFQRNLSREWAVLPRDATGRGSYDGYNGNRAGVSHNELFGALSAAKGRKGTTPTTNVGIRPINPPDDNYPDEGARRGVTPASYITEDEELSYGKGGLVQHFARGGVVEEEDAPLPPTRPAGIRLPGVEVQAAPVRPVAGGEDRGRESFREDAGTRGSPISFSPRDFTDLELVGEAAHEGLIGVQNFFGFDRGVRDPQRVQAFANGEGAASQLEIKEVDSVIDPRRTLTPEERNIARLNAGYKFYRDRGEPEKARRYAASMLMAANDTVRQLGAVARVALESGDYKGAAKAIAAGKSAVPDGESVRVVGEPGKDGVQFEVFDQDGYVTERGKAAIDDLMRVATGMMDGSLFFEQAGMIRGKTSRERQAEKRRKANEEFEKIAPAGDYRERYIDTLDERQKAAFLKLNPSDQKAKIAEWERGLTAAERSQMQQQNRSDRQQRHSETREDRALGREQRQSMFDRRMGAAEDRATATGERHRERMDYRIRRDEVLDGRWEQNRKDRLTAEEAQLAQRFLEEDGRNKRQDKSIEQRRLYQAQADMRAMRQLRGGGGGQRSGPSSVKERAVAGAEAAGQAERSAITNDPAMYGVDVNAENPAEPVQGPTPEIARRLSMADAGTAYEKRVKENPNRFHQNNIESIDRALDDISGGTQLPARERYAYRNIATDILKGNDMGGDQAAATAVALIQSKGKGIQVLQDGRVQVDPNLPPVYLSRQALAQIAAMMAQAAPAAEVGVREPRKPGPRALQDPRAGNYLGR